MGVECEHYWLPLNNATSLICKHCKVINPHVIDDEGFCLSCWEFHDQNPETD